MISSRKMWKHVCALLLLALAAAHGSHVDQYRLQRVKAAVQQLNSRSGVSHSTGFVRRHTELTPMAYEEEIKAFLEKLKEMMRQPIDSLGIPTLDPLEVEGPIEIDIASDLVELAGSVSNIRVDNLSRFETVSASFNIIGFKLSLAIFFEEIYASGNYDLDGSFLNGLLLVYGEGPFTVSVKNVSLSVDISLKSNNSVPYIDSLNIDYDVPIVTTNFTGLLGGGDLSDVANELISDLVPYILDTGKDRLLGAIVPTIIEMANNALSGYTFNDIICIVVGLC